MPSLLSANGWEYGSWADPCEVAATTIPAVPAICDRVSVTTS